MEDIGLLRRKYKQKIINAQKDGFNVYLTFEEYLAKAEEAGIKHPDEISPSGFHLSRVNDEGDYRNDNCRFLPCKENHREKKHLRGVNHPCYGKPGNLLGKKVVRSCNRKLSDDMVVAIFNDTRKVGEICKEYNVVVSTVNKIKRREIYSYLTS
jgi:hypothetical protein